MLGRFGWKANKATLKDQVTDAFSSDLGISSSLRPANAGDCTSAQTACLAAPDGGDIKSGGVEINDHLLDLVTLYSRNLAVPARRDGNPDVMAGKNVQWLHCLPPAQICYPTDPLRPEQSFQLSGLARICCCMIWAMGLPIIARRICQWRGMAYTAAWGIGLTKTISRHTYFLHDGRARGLLEAILWHGGEAAAARNRVITPDNRAREPSPFS